MNWYSKGKIWALLNASGFPLYLRCVADVHLWDKAWKRGRVHACVYWLKCVFKPSLSVFVHTHVCLFAHTCLLILSKMKDCSSTDREMEERSGFVVRDELLTQRSKKSSGPGTQSTHLHAYWESGLSRFSYTHTVPQGEFHQSAVIRASVFFGVSKQTTVRSWDQVA